MDWLSSGVMFAWYASVLVVIGAAGAVRVMAPLEGSLAHGWTSSALRLARLAIPLVLLALIARLWLQTWQAFGSDQTLTMEHALVIITESPWGDGWIWQMAASLGAGLVILRASPARSPLHMLAALVVGGTVGMTGHAAGAESAAALIIAHGLHVLAVGLWLGSLGVILWATRQTPPGDAATRDRLAHVIGRFSPQAMVAVGVLASSGLVAAWQHVATVASLFTPYGYVLTAKVIAFGAAGLCGLYNWRVVRPALTTHPDGVSHLRSMAALELACSVIALVLTSILTSMPMPM
jgi:putative copper export protein